jgi:hypothetical protein
MGMSEAKAQALFLKEQYLKEIGDYYNLIDPTEFPVAEQMLMYYGKLFNDTIQANLDKSGSIASGRIGDLVVPKIKKFGNNYEMQLGYDPNNPASVYYRFVNKGVRGAGGENARPKRVSSDSPYQFKTPFPNQKMAKSILEWYKLGKAKANTDSQKKGLSATQTKNRRLKQVANKPLTLMQVAYRTAAAIKRDGLKTTSYFDNAVKTVFNKEFFETMAVAFGGDVQLQIRQIGNKIESSNGNNSK